MKASSLIATLLLLPLQAYSGIDCESSSDGEAVFCIASSMDELNTVHGDFSDCTTFSAGDGSVALFCNLNTSSSTEKKLISPQDSMRKPEYR